ncbi:MAG: HDOD domain-containing protein [Planctomycetes bacterium]|nr:HDOD domain-containing protein [Planctomycetota bacterium]MCB9889892.1 HDOD domain-containing protein [Planctomycetota bacterium]
MLKSVQEVEVLPSSAVEIVRIAQDPEADAGQVERAIALDPVLTARVLKMANSSLLGGRAETRTVRDAVVRLGSGRVIAAALDSGPLAAAPVEGYELRPGALWEAAAATALTAEELARACGTRAPREVFTAALLCDLGKLVLGPFVCRHRDAIMALAFEGDHAFDAAEREVLGIDHAEVGALLLERWQLPAEIVQIVRWHHLPSSCDESMRGPTDLVHAAEHLCAMAGLGSGVDGTQYRADPATVTRLGLKPSVVEAVLCETASKLVEVRTLRSGEAVELR